LKNLLVGLMSRETAVQSMQSPRDSGAETQYPELPVRGLCPANKQKTSYFQRSQTL